MGHLWDALSRAYDAFGFEKAAGGDEVFRQLVLARIIEPTSKLDSLRVLEEAGVDPASYRTVNRRLPVYAKDDLAPRPGRGVRDARGPRPGEPGALRRHHAVLRDRQGRRVPRARVLQGTPPGAADHRRLVDRRARGSR